MTICDIVGTLFNYFDSNGIIAFRNFVNRHPAVSKWSIASDYSNQNKCFVFTIFPYTELPQETFNYIQSKLPKDIKKTRDISKEAIYFFHEPNRFYISFIIQGKPILFTPNVGHTSLNVIRNCIAADYNRAVVAGGAPEALMKMKALHTESQKNNFNQPLFNNILILSAFYVFISLLLSRERKTEIIGWFSDRDKMTSYCSGVIWVLSMQAFGALSVTMGITSTPEIVIGGNTETPIPMWYDQLIRPADYLAAALASLNINADGSLVREDTKHYKILATTLPDNENIVVFQLKFEKNSSFATIAQMTFSAKQNEQSDTLPP